MVTFYAQDDILMAQAECHATWSYRYQDLEKEKDKIIDESMALEAEYMKVSRIATERAVEINSLVDQIEEVAKNYKVRFIYNFFFQ